MSCPRIINHYFTVGKNQQINNQIKEKKNKLNSSCSINKYCNKIETKYISINFQKLFQKLKLFFYGMFIIFSLKEIKSSVKRRKTYSKRCYEFTLEHLKITFFVLPVITKY
jgi:hypothetical protein